MDVLQRQLAALRGAIPAEGWANVAIAYEPVWAIGEGAEPCSPDEAERIHRVLRAWVRNEAGAQAATACRIVYTGSVSVDNAALYASSPEVDGYVVGRAGLDASAFVRLLEDLGTKAVPARTP